MKSSDAKRRMHPAVWFAFGVVAAILGLYVLHDVKTSVSHAREDSEFARLAKLVSRPLRIHDSLPTPPTVAEAQTRFREMMQEADELGKGTTETALVAQEFKQAIEATLDLTRRPPNPQPLLRAGLDTWKGSANNDDTAFLLGLLNLGSELSKATQSFNDAESIHQRVIGCRLSVASMAERKHAQTTMYPIASATFRESQGGWFSDEVDTLSLNNQSGLELTNVLVVVELEGSYGDRFKNVFFSDSWGKGRSLYAQCVSQEPFRETVTRVTSVRFRIFSDQRVSPWVEMSTRAQAELR